MNVTGSPIPFELRGEEFQIYPLTDAAIESLSNWVRGDLLRSVRQSLDGCPPEEWDRSMALAMKTAITIDWWDDSAKLALLTPRGRAKLFQESLRRPRFTHQRCIDLFTIEEDGVRKHDSAKLEEFWSLFVFVNDLTGDEVPQKKNDVSGNSRRRLSQTLRKTWHTAERTGIANPDANYVDIRRHRPTHVRDAGRVRSMEGRQWLTVM